MARELLESSCLFTERVKYLAGSARGDGDWAVVVGLVETLCDDFKERLQICDDRLMEGIVRGNA